MAGSEEELRRKIRTHDLVLRAIIAALEKGRPGAKVEIMTRLEQLEDTLRDIKDPIADDLREATKGLRAYSLPDG